ncbi:MAG: hypothetical protein EOP83_02065 [Verrucomicrobiaceae bacterium]|nr:MAG: hypothetical protein EOP83_02065 [Verrucomicrobiaceae bacterium]
MINDTKDGTRQRVDAVIAGLSTSWGTGGLEMACIRDAVENNELREAVYLLCSLSESLKDYGSQKDEIVALATEMGEIDMMPFSPISNFTLIS